MMMIYMTDKEKKIMSEKILNHTLEIIYLLTGEASLLQHLSNSPKVKEMDIDKVIKEKILKPTIEIICLLNREEYTIVKKNSPHSSIHHLSGEVSILHHLPKLLTMNKGKKKITERILNHSLEIIYLLTGEVSLLQHLTNSQIMVETNKAKKMSEGILTHALEIIYLLTGEEYTIVKTDSLPSGIHHITGEYHLDGHMELLDENHQTLGITENRSPGNQDENVHSVSINEEGGYEREENNIHQVETHPGLCTGYSNVEPSIFSRLEQDELEMRVQKQVKKEDISINIDEDGYMDKNASGQNNSLGVTNALQGGNSSSNRTPVKKNKKSIINLAKASKCSDCGKYFRFKCQLIRHQKIHSGEKPFACSQ
ncbi:uncharacterized protein O3C94_016865 [Discoglossus pictus]